MVITIEPALVEGHHAHATWSDGWSQCTVDGGLAAQFYGVHRWGEEHTDSDK